jgi:hypothetical protein
MIVTFNVKGFGIPSNKSTFHRVVELHKSYMYLLQETIGDGEFFLG